MHPTSRRVDLADTQLTDRPETFRPPLDRMSSTFEEHVPPVNSPAADILRNFDLL